MNKLFYKIFRAFKYLVNINFLSHHKIQNKNQITNIDFIINNLKQKNIKPQNIVDIGCAMGEWTKKMIRHFPNSKYYLFDADDTNIDKIKVLSKKYSNISFKHALLSNDEKDYKFYKMGYGSSIYNENSPHNREEVTIASTTLKKELLNKIDNNSDNILKIDVQGAELNVLDGLDDYIDKFDFIILEISIQQYNKGAPLFYDVINYMKKKNFKLYDIFDLKRLGENKSFLIQLDAIFIKEDSNLFKNFF